MADRKEQLTLGEEELDRDAIMRLTPGQRMEMVWTLTKKAWGITEETPLRRDIVRVIRRRPIGSGPRDPDGHDHLG